MKYLKYILFSFGVLLFMNATLFSPQIEDFTEEVEQVYNNSLILGIICFTLSGMIYFVEKKLQ